MNRSDTITHLLPLVPEVVQEISMRYELSDEAQRFLEGHTANHVHYMRIETVRYFLHCLNLLKKVPSLFT